MLTRKTLIVVASEFGDRVVRNIGGCDEQNIGGGGKQNW
jgi:hypothetical protein